MPEATLQNLCAACFSEGEMRFFKSKIAAYLTDICCCILLGASVCAIFLPYVGVEADYGTCLLLTTADLALIVLFTRKWWLFPVCLISIFLITLLITTIFNVSQELWSYIEGFIRWFSASYPNTLPYSENGSIIIVQLAFALPAAVLSFLYFRRLFLFPVLPPVSAALMVWAYLTDREIFLPVLVMLIFVMFLSMAKMTSNRINRNLPEAEKIPGALLIVTAMIIVIVVLFFTFSVSPKNDSDWRAKWLVNTVEDFREYFGLGRKGTLIQGTFDIGVSGFNPLEQRLGGNVVIDNTTVMKVTTETPVFLKGAVYDTYDGQRWRDSYSSRRYRFLSILWQEERRDMFSLDKPYGGNPAKELFAKITYPADFEISYLERGRTLFAAGQVQSLKSGSLDISDVFFNDQSELFISEPHWSLKYRLHTIVFDRNLAGFDDNMLALEAFTKYTEDKYMEAICSEYMQLPDSLPESVYRSAEDITGNFDTPYKKAIAIESWLAENCTYTLSPGEPLENEDFVGQFLKKREGYCVYYASAMTVLARASGLPARFITGYALKRNPSTNAQDSYLATNATAHAWTEIYFQGIGWIPFDPIQWNFNQYAMVEQRDDQGYYPGQSSAPLPIDGIDGNIQKTHSGMPVEIRIILIAIMCLLITVIIIAAVRFISFFKGARGYYDRLCRKYDTIGERVSASYRKIIRQAAFLGIKQEPGDTITTFAKRVDEYLDSNEMTVFCDCVIRMRFGFEEPCDTELMKLCEFSAALEKRLRTDLGLSGYLWRRILIGR
jgi:hypothetical protein